MTGIGEAEAVRRLAQACPGFRDTLAAYEDTGGRLDEGFNVMSELAQWVVEQAKAGAFACFDELFDELEVLLGNSDADARQVLVIGFLEDIHNFTVRLESPATRSDPDAFLAYLGAASRGEWFRLVANYVKWGEAWPGRVADG